MPNKRMETTQQTYAPLLQKVATENEYIFAEIRLKMYRSLRCCPIDKFLILKCIELNGVQKLNKKLIFITKF